MEVSMGTRARRGVKFLLILLVVKAAADCSIPKAPGNTVLSDQSLLLNIFPEGVEAYFDCAYGYVVESGSGKITCVQSIWTEPDLVCKKMDCGPPKAKPNMSFDISAGTLVGADIRVLCNTGFKLSGPSYKKCYPKGWSGNPKCHIISCGPPGNVTNGRSLWDSKDDPLYGDVIHYVCNQGYTLIGNSSTSCSASGGYDSPAPTCEGVRTEETMASPTSTPPQEVSPSTESSASLTARSDKTTSATQTVSPSGPGTEEFLHTTARSSAETLLGTARGGGILTAGGQATTTTGTSLRDAHGGAVDTNEGLGHTAVVISVICVASVVCLLALCLHRFLLRRKGSANGAVGTY
ncbi:complement decay-accelerating factor isoform X2 [Pungitius pungitius]|uniref:complement decay-accelerating factor isoform X2 n=1 Tax=Pungitius pungitius TaxID=134920 RepID=UPI002E137C9C